jgi:hypothetical protein
MQEQEWQRAYDKSYALRHRMNAMEMVPVTAMKPEHVEAGVQRCFTDTLDTLRKIIHICDKKLDFRNAKAEQEEAKRKQGTDDLAGWKEMVEDGNLDMRLEVALRQTIIDVQCGLARDCTGGANEWNLQRFVDMGLDIPECEFDTIVRAAREQALVVMFG